MVLFLDIEEYKNQRGLESLLDEDFQRGPAWERVWLKCELDRICSPQTSCLRRCVFDVNSNLKTHSPFALFPFFYE